MPVLGTSENFLVLLGRAKMASLKSLSTLVRLTSKAATTSMSEIL